MQACRFVVAKGRVVWGSGKEIRQSNYMIIKCLASRIPGEELLLLKAEARPSQSQIM